MVDLEATLLNEKLQLFRANAAARQARGHLGYAARYFGSAVRRTCGRGEKNWELPRYSTASTPARPNSKASLRIYIRVRIRERSCASDRKKVMILGSGPNRIGQGIEFDYCCCHASFALQEFGYESIMVNCNPETVSTDYDTSDRLYFEPLTLEEVLKSTISKNRMA